MGSKVSRRKEEGKEVKSESKRRKMWKGSRLRVGKEG